MIAIASINKAIASFKQQQQIFDTDEERETKLEQAFSQWLASGESFKVKAEQVAKYATKRL